MPDYSMCRNPECESRYTCARYMWEPNPWRQAYADFKPEEGKDKCDYYFWVDDAPCTKRTVEQMKKIEAVLDRVEKSK